MGIHTGALGAKYIVFEYSNAGFLSEYLLENKDKVNSGLLLKTALTAAKGMEYLEKKGVLQRDLSTKTILISKSGAAKVTQFSAATSAQGNPNVRIGAPEAHTDSQLTSKSDVWNYAVCLWEIFSYGAEPFEGMSDSEILEVTNKEDNDEILKKPKDCPEGVYAIMKRCWSHSPSARPSFAEIVTELETLRDNLEGARKSVQFTKGDANV